VILVFLATLTLVSSAALAQPAAPRVLHERVEFSFDAPDGSPVALPGEEVLRPPAAVVPARAVLDSHTEGDERLDYHAVFDPTPVPFKRVLARDRVGADGALSVGDPARVPVPLVGRVRPVDREEFAGDLLVSLEPGKPTPVPSVAADARILDVVARPAVRLRFTRDGADNLYVEGDDEPAATVRLTLRLDARRDYFGAPVPPDARLGDVPAGLAPRLPPAVQGRAAAVLRAAGVRPGEDRVEPLLAALVGWFRGFSPGSVPRVHFSADPYLAIALSRTGVCRHRAHAFVVTAQAAGLPARYVVNEAHAFAEAWIPGRGWQRIDLGGAARELTVHGAEGRAVHRPALADPFPRPEPEPAPERRSRPAPRPAAAPPPPAPAGPPPTALSLRLDRSRVRRGEAVLATGRVANEDGPVGAGEVLLSLHEPVEGAVVHRWAPVRPDRAGRFSLRMLVPEDLAPGDYHLIAVFADPEERYPPALSDERALDWQR